MSLLTSPEVPPLFSSSFFFPPCGIGPLRRRRRQCHQKVSSPPLSFRLGLDWMGRERRKEEGAGGVGREGAREAQSRVGIDVWAAEREKSVPEKNGEKCHYWALGMTGGPLTYSSLKFWILFGREINFARNCFPTFRLFKGNCFNFFPLLLLFHLLRAISLSSSSSSSFPLIRCWSVQGRKGPDWRDFSPDYLFFISSSSSSAFACIFLREEREREKPTLHHLRRRRRSPKEVGKEKQGWDLTQNVKLTVLTN